MILHHQCVCHCDVWFVAVTVIIIIVSAIVILIPYSNQQGRSKILSTQFSISSTQKKEEGGGR